MSRHRTRWQILLPTLVLGVASAATADAQGPVSTGTNLLSGRDQSWQVTTTGGGFTQAFLVASNPGWSNFTGPDAARWISVSASASGGPTPYTYRTSFNLTGFDASTARLVFRCGADDAFNGYRLNGGSFIGGGTGALGSTGVCGAYALGTTAVTVASGFQAGINTLEFATAGNAITDGFIVNVDEFSARQVPGSTVPEPGTWALLGTGLIAIGGIGARRRRSAA